MTASAGRDSSSDRASSTRPDDADAFFPDPGEGPARVHDDLAQVLAEDFLIAATSGEEVNEEVLSGDLLEEDEGQGPPAAAEPEFAFGDPEAHPVTARPTSTSTSTGERGSP